MLYNTSLDFYTRPCSVIVQEANLERSLIVQVFRVRVSGTGLKALSPYRCLGPDLKPSSPKPGALNPEPGGQKALKTTSLKILHHPES